MKQPCKIHITEKMKKLVLRILTICISCCISSAAHSQTISFKRQILYQMSFQQDSSDKTTVQEEIMELLLNDSLTIFQSEKTGIRDSIELNERKSNESFKLSPELISKLRTPVKYSIFKYPDGNVLFKENFTSRPTSESNTKYYEEQVKFDWELSNDTATINGLLCQKATLNYAGRKWTAWFATEIPLNEGPYKFKGLPGLIVKLSDERGTWLFNLLQIKPANRTIVVPNQSNTRSHTISKAEFYKEKRYYIENETIIKESNGLLSFRDQTVRKKMVENDKKKSDKDNNWIEEPASGH